MVQVLNFLCATIIKFENTEVPGETSWKVSIWHLMSQNGSLQKNPNCNTAKSWIYNSDCFHTIRQSWVAFLSTEIFQHALYQIPSVGFESLRFQKSRFIKKTILDQDQALFCFYSLSFAGHALLADRQTSALHQKRTRQGIANLFWDSVQKLTRKNYSNYCSTILA